MISSAGVNDVNPRSRTSTALRASARVRVRANDGEQFVLHDVARRRVRRDRQSKAKRLHRGAERREARCGAERVAESLSRLRLRPRDSRLRRRERDLCEEPSPARAESTSLPAARRKSHARTGRSVSAASVYAAAALSNMLLRSNARARSVRRTARTVGFFASRSAAAARGRAAVSAPRSSAERVRSSRPSPSNSVSSHASLAMQLLDLLPSAPSGSSARGNEQRRRCTLSRSREAPAP